MKEKCRWCVVVCHGGEEFTTLPAPYTRNLYFKYLEFGADIVVSHHPHVPMNYERVGDKIIFYSLGNFIFDTDYQRAQPNTDMSVLIKINFTEDSYSFDALGTKIIRGEEKIVAGPLPDIFTDIQEDEYNKLIPMGAKALLANERRKMCFMDANKYGNFTDDDWHDFFQDYKNGARIKNQLRDLALYEELAKQADNGLFETSELEKVKEYIVKQIID